MFAVAYYQLTNYASANSQIICKLMVFIHTHIPSIYLFIYKVCANPISSMQRLSHPKWVEVSRHKACDQLEIKKPIWASQWGEQMDVLF